MHRAFTAAGCQQHQPPFAAPERPARLEAVLGGASDAGWPVEDSPAHALSASAVARLHAPRYVERFERAIERGDGLLDSADNPLSKGTLEAARAAVDVCLTAADWVATGERRKAFAAVRPPGHHAERDVAMGFCYFANVALAAEQLVGEHSCERVAIFDFDVHHGNGTQHLFEKRRDIFFASVHQYPFYPGTGSAAERGSGDGIGRTLNVPLPAGTDDWALREAVEGTVLPALRDFRPEVLLVSAGFDGWENDPLGGWKLSEEAYAWMGRELAALADDLCGGRMLSVLEGGYSLAGLRLLTRRYLEAR